MLQVFHLNVAKLDQDVAYLCKCIISKCFRCFYTYVASVLSRCLHVCNGYTRVFKFFFGVLQVFQTYIASVLFGYCKSRSGVAHVAMCGPTLALFTSDSESNSKRQKMGDSYQMQFSKKKHKIPHY
jgi:hypothetical protein